MLMWLQLKPVGVGRLFELNADVESTHYTVPTHRTSNADNSVSSLLSKLIAGQLIYPWIERASKC